MRALSTSLSFLLGLLLWVGLAAADEQPDPQMSGRPQVLQVQGSELTGLNAGTLVDSLKRAREQGVQALVLDLGGIVHMTEAGMDALVQGAKIFGVDHFGAANLSGEPARLAQTKGTGRFRVYPTVEAATASLGE